MRKVRPGGAIAALLILGALLVPAAAFGVRGAGAGELKPFFDSRAGAGAVAKSPSPATRAATGRIDRSPPSLRDRLGRSGVLDVNPITNTPRSLLKLDGALSGPSGGDRDAIARSFLRTNAAALGLSMADTDLLALAKRVDAPGGVTILRYRQSFRGIPAFDNGVRVALDRAGRVLGITGSPQPGLSVESITPQIDAAAAMRALQRSVGASKAMRITAGPVGARRTTRFATGAEVPPAAAKPLPVITIARTGTRGQFTVRVTCAQRCALNGKVTVTKSVARKLRLERRTIRTLKRTISSTARQTIRVQLSKSMRTSLSKRRVRSVVVSARFTASYADKRKRTAARRVNVRT